MMTLKGHFEINWPLGSFEMRHPVYKKLCEISTCEALCTSFSIFQKTTTISSLSFLKSLKIWASTVSNKGVSSKILSTECM